MATKEHIERKPEDQNNFTTKTQRPKPRRTYHFFGVNLFENLNLHSRHVQQNYNYVAFSI